jgi:RNA polymerase sigma-70 factor (ECF subfamily)
MRLYAAHRRGIKAYINKKLGDPATAEDLTQEAFLRLTEGNGGAITHGRAWLYRTAHNLAVDHGRQTSRRRTDAVDVDGLSALADDSPSPEHIVADRMELDRLTRIIEELPERTQKVFVAVRIDGRTYTETAQMLGISDSSVQKHLARAVHHVMRRMKS